MSKDVTAKIRLTSHQYLWLNTACRMVREGKLPDSRTLRVDLLGQIPSGFDANEIDPRLLRHGASPTILSLTLLAPDLTVVNNARLVWRSIHGLLRARPTIKVITADDIAQSTLLSKMDVAETFFNLLGIGLHGSGTIYAENGRTGWGSIEVNDTAFQGFIEFDGPDQFLTSIMETNDALGENNHSLLDQDLAALPLSQRRFKVALSFPGEKRSYVVEVAEALRKQLGEVFYDNFFIAELARPNLDTLLQKIYHDNSDLIVAFLCEDYERKEWCGLEWRAVRDLIKKRYDNIMLMRFDDAEVAGALSIDGHVDLRDRTPIQAADLIVKRYKTINQPTNDVAQDPPGKEIKNTPLSVSSSELAARAFPQETEKRTSPEKIKAALELSQISTKLYNEIYSYAANIFIASPNEEMRQIRVGLNEFADAISNCEWMFDTPVARAARDIHEFYWMTLSGIDRGNADRHYPNNQISVAGIAVRNDAETKFREQQHEVRDRLVMALRDDMQA